MKSSQRNEIIRIMHTHTHTHTHTHKQGVIIIMIIYKIPGNSSLHKIQILHFAALLFTFGEYYQCY